MHTLLLKNARYVVSCDDQDHVYEYVDVLIQDRQIVRIGPHLSIDSPVDEILDCTGKALYPGLINTHHHFFQTFVRNRMSIDYPQMTVIEWLDRIYRIFVNLDEEMIYQSSLIAMSDLLKHGCTTAFDHQYCHTKPNGRHMLDQQVKAATQLGIRYVGGRGANTLPRSEGSTIPDAMLETTDEFLTDCERLVHAYHDPHPFAMTQMVIAPCQPVNSYEDTFTEAVKLARHLGVRLHTHLGEGENAVIEERYGQRTLDWCIERGFIGEDVWFAHCWELTSDEFQKLGDFGSGVAHCPAPAVLGGFPILDMKQIQSTGTVLSLGCDGSATNDSSNLLDTIRLAYVLQAWHSKSRGGSISPYELIKMATMGGAKTLGRPELGSLAEGKAADLFAIDLDRLELVGALHDPKNLIPRLATTGEVDFTMVNGEVVFRKGTLTRVDEAQLKQDADQSQRKIQALFE